MCWQRQESKEKQVSRKVIEEIKVIKERGHLSKTVGGLFLCACIDVEMSMECCNRIVKIFYKGNIDKKTVLLI